MKKNVDNSVVVNKHPYFLWSKYIMEKASIDNSEKILYGEEKSSHYIKANPMIILLLKYVPLLIFVPFLSLPHDVRSLLFFSVSLVLVAVLIFFYRKEKFFYIRVFIFILLFAIAFTAIKYPEINIENIFFELLHYIGISLLAYIVVMDFFKYDYKQFYKLEDIQKNVETKLLPAGERKMMKIPFTKRSLFSYNIKEDFKLSFLVGGYYFTILNSKKETHETV